ncbi:MAG: hypothetical protein Q7S12_03795 [bacterium]|nr:hypothetical protein [bacterium]
MKKFLPSIGMLLTILGGILLTGVIEWYYNTHNNTSIYFGGAYTMIIGMTIVYFSLKKYFPDFIENEEHRMSAKVTGKHWIIFVIIIFALLVFLSGYGINWF